MSSTTLYTPGNPEFVTYGDMTFQQYVSAEEMDQSDHAMAEAIYDAYADLDPVLLAIDRGGRAPRDTLVNNLDIINPDMKLTPAEMRISSYAGERATSGIVKVVNPPNILLRGRHILAIDDIDDTRTSLAFLRDYLTAHNPASLAVAVSLSKIGVPKGGHPDPQYIGRRIEDKFVIGRGLDYKDIPETRRHSALYRAIDIAEGAA